MAEGLSSSTGEIFAVFAAPNKLCFDHRYIFAAYSSALYIYIYTYDVFEICSWQGKLRPVGSQKRRHWMYV